MTYATGVMAAAGMALALGAAWQAADGTSPPSPRTLKVLMLGDSLTKYGMAPATEKELNALTQGAIQWTCVNAGVGGEAAEAGKGRLAALLEKENPDLVTVEYGGNDMAKGYTPAKFREHLEGIIQIVQSRSPAPRVVLMTVTGVDGNRHSFGKNKKFNVDGGPDRYLEKQFNAVTRKLAADRQLPLVDMHRQYAAAPDPMALLVKDGIHLTPEAYKYIGAHVARTLLAYCQADVYKAPQAVKARADAVARLAEVRKQLAKAGEARAAAIKDAIKALDEIWRACPYLSDAALVWHEVTYPSSATRPAAGRAP